MYAPEIFDQDERHATVIVLMSRALYWSKMRPLPVIWACARAPDAATVLGGGAGAGNPSTQVKLPGCTRGGFLRGGRVGGRRIGPAWLVV